MGFLTGKKFLITGVLSNRSIAYGIAQACRAQGAELAFSYVGERFKDRITEFAAEFDSRLIFDCDVGDDAQIEQLFKDLSTHWPKFDGFVHSIGFAPREAITGNFLDGLSRENFRIAHDISAYSFPAMAKAALPYLNDKGALLTLSYLGAMRAIPKRTQARHQLRPGLRGDHLIQDGVHGRVLEADHIAGTFHVRCLGAVTFQQLGTRGLATDQAVADDLEVEDIHALLQDGKVDHPVVHLDAQLLQVACIGRHDAAHGPGVVQELDGEGLALGVAQRAVAVGPASRRQQVACAAQVVTQGVAGSRIQAGYGRLRHLLREYLGRQLAS